MRCFGNFRDDRVCDLCNVSNNTVFIKCKEIYKENEVHQKSTEEKLDEIWKKCPHRHKEWSSPFWCCRRSGLRNGVHGECIVTFECEKYGR